MYLTLEEKETIILFNEADDTASCDTCNRKLINKLDDLCKRSGAITVTRQDKHGKTYTFPKKWIRVQMPVVFSEEQRQKMAERGRASKLFSKGGQENE